MIGAVLAFLAIHHVSSSVLITDRTASSRSVHKSFLPAKAIDGKTNTRFESSSDANPEWFKVTFARENYVDKVVIINRYTDSIVDVIIMIA